MTNTEFIRFKVFTNKSNNQISVIPRRKDLERNKIGELPKEFRVDAKSFFGWLK